MQNEGRIVELLAEMLIKQDVFIDELRNVKGELVGTNQRLDGHSAILKEHSDILKEHSEILTRHERLLKRNDRQNERILELLSKMSSDLTKSLMSSISTEESESSCIKANTHRIYSLKTRPD